MTIDLSLYVVLDPRLTGGRSPVEIARAAIQGGATALQLRDKEATTRDLLDLARALAGLAREAGIPFIVNDRVDVALATGASGVHLGPDDLPVATARAIMGPAALIGFSAGTADEARAGGAEGASYLGTGAVYATPSKSDAGTPIGVDGLAAVVTATRLPVVAIGGITAGRAAPCIEAGAAGVAVISAVTLAGDVAAAAQMLRGEVDAARREKGRRRTQ